MAKQRDKGRDPNSARKKRRAAQFGHIRTARDAHAQGDAEATTKPREKLIVEAKPPAAPPARAPQSRGPRARPADRQEIAGRRGAAIDAQSRNEQAHGQRPRRTYAPRDGEGPQPSDGGDRESRGPGGPRGNRDERGQGDGRGPRGDNRDDARRPNTSRTQGGKQRRSLSMPRSPGRIHADGPRDLCEALVASLRAPADDEQGIADSLSHPFHTYPARLHPATARILVDVVASTRAGRGPLVDPFCGSGTVLVEARAAGLRAVGTDLNPLATLIAHAKTWTVVARRRREFRETGHAIGGAVLAAGKEARRAGAQPLPQRKPAGFDPNARDRKLASWFAPHVRRELELIANHIDEVRARDAELADVLTACLSAVLYKVSSRTSDTDDTWIQRDIARGAATRHFIQRIDLLEAGLADLPGGSPAEIYLTDVRQLGEFVADGGASGIVTSPPYAGTYDYADHQRLRFDFLALRHREFEAGEIGSRRSFREAALPAEKAWRAAMADFLDVMARALAPGARAAIVIGDSWAGGRAYYAIDDIRSALGGDLFVEAWASMERPMLGTGELRAFGDRPKSEHVILLRK